MAKLLQGQLLLLLFFHCVFQGLVCSISHIHLDSRSVRRKINGRVDISSSVTASFQLGLTIEMSDSPGDWRDCPEISLRILDYCGLIIIIGTPDALVVSCESLLQIFSLLWLLLYSLVVPERTTLCPVHGAIRSRHAHVGGEWCSKAG